MAQVIRGSLLNGLQGKLGPIVFKKLRGKTIVAAWGKPHQKQSEHQGANRQKFKQASVWARLVLQDEARRMYYVQKAKKLKLPNAYTAAITDYMRRPQVQEACRTECAVKYRINKRQFGLQKVVQLVPGEHGMQERELTARWPGEWLIWVTKEELRRGTLLKMTDDTGQAYENELKE